MDWTDTETQVATQALVECRKCKHLWVDGMKYPICCPECGSVQWRYVRDKQLIKDFAEQAVDNHRIVCPICGLIWEEGVPVVATESISSWVERGYNPIACPGCVDAGRTVGCSFEFSEVTK